MRTAFGMSFDVPTGYLNTAGIGVPSTETASAVANAVARWGRGQDTPGDFESAVATSRSMFARLVGVPAERVAIGAAVSQLVGLIGASLPDGSRVLVAKDEFTSLTFPFAAQRDRGVQITEVDLAEIPQRAAEHDLVAVAVVQSGDGRIVDLDGLREAISETPTRVLLDTSQAAGWMPLRLGWADWVLGTSYKWLLSPRGAAWMAVRPDAMELVRPHSANWYAGQDRWDALYGLPLRLADGARALDISPVWLAHIGAAVAMASLADVDMTQVAAHCTGLADEFRSALGMPPGRSAIVAVDAPDAIDRLDAAGIRASARAGKARLSFHLYNIGDDVERAVRALRPH